MRVLLHLTIFLTCLLSACSASKSGVVDHQSEIVKIKSVLVAQQEAWNEGDIDKFMLGYWNDNELSFIGSKGVTKGWRTTLQNYHKGYPNQDAMGKLHFDVLEIDVLSHNAAYMIGKYTLKRKEDSPSGYFNLLWKKVEGNWLIVSDHTSG